MASYIRGLYANAAVDLIDELGRKGIAAYVGYRDRKRRRTLIVVTDPRHFADIPREWNGFTVITEEMKP